jgi:hypothetical protein
MSVQDAREHRKKLLEIHLRNLATVLQQASVFGRDSAPVHLLHRLADELDSVLSLSATLQVSDPPLVEDAYRFLGRPRPEVLLASDGLSPALHGTDQGDFDAFLSHSSADQSAVRYLAERLRERNLRIWLDEEQIGPGDSIAGKIEDGLARSRYILLCVSDQVKESDWCRAEYRPLLHREIRRRETRVIPVIIGSYDRETAPALLYDKLHIDIRSPAEFERLVKTLQ